MKSHRVLGLMSGSSLDGLDLAVCDFHYENHQLINWDLIEAKTTPLPYMLREFLFEPLKLSEQDLLKLEQDLTVFFIDEIKSVNVHKPKIELIGSHGHTVQHLPKQKITRQLGDVRLIAEATKITTVGDFRQQDIIAGGVGTPMAPLADRDLYPGFDYYLNIGGIANISYRQKGIWKAFDLFPANQILNYFAAKEGLEYDKDGDLAEEGNLSRDLLNFLLSHPYIEKLPPKSLDNNEVKTKWIQQMESFKLSVRDYLFTYCEFFALMLQKTFAEAGIIEGTIMVTGGGAYNKYLIDKCQAHNPKIKFSPASDDTINYKEAILIAYAALLKKLERPNFISSVTGASHDVIGGHIENPK